jgi:hypothetical protein
MLSLIARNVNRKEGEDLLKLMVLNALGCLLALSIMWANDDENQLKIGNLALSSALAPGPLFSFGQNIIDKHDFLLWESLEVLKARNSRYLLGTTSFLYGVSDTLSLLANVPIAKYQQNRACNKGLSNISLQAEWAFYVNDQLTYTNQLTWVTALRFPAPKRMGFPSLGSKAPGFFLGTTASHLSIKWYSFLTLGGWVIAPDKNQGASTQLLYEAGLGYNLGNPADGILLALLEANGIRSTQKRIGEIITKHNNANIMFVGPSLYWATKKWIAQLGYQIPLFQKIQNGSKFAGRYAAFFAWYF